MNNWCLVECGSPTFEVGMWKELQGERPSLSFLVTAFDLTGWGGLLSCNAGFMIMGVRQVSESFPLGRNSV